MFFVSLHIYCQTSHNSFLCLHVSGKSAVSCPFRISSPEAAGMYMQSMVASHSTFVVKAVQHHILPTYEPYMLKFAWGAELMAVCENAQERVWNKPVSDTVRQWLNEANCVLDNHNDSLHRCIKRPIFKKINGLQQLASYCIKRYYCNWDLRHVIWIKTLQLCRIFPWKGWTWNSMDTTCKCIQ